MAATLAASLGTCKLVCKAFSTHCLVAQNGAVVLKQFTEDGTQEWSILRNGDDTLSFKNVGDDTTYLAYEGTQVKASHTKVNWKYDKLPNDNCYALHPDDDAWNTYALDALSVSQVQLRNRNTNSSNQEWNLQMILP